MQCRAASPHTKTGLACQRRSRIAQNDLQSAEQTRSSRSFVSLSRGRGRTPLPDVLDLETQRVLRAMLDGKASRARRAVAED